MRDLIAWIVGGAIVGGLARLFLPGRQAIGILWTIVIGIIGGLIGGWIARALGLGGLLSLVGSVLVAMGLLMLFVGYRGRAV